MNNWFIWFIAVTAFLGPIIYSVGTIRKLILAWWVHITWISALPRQGWVEVIGKVRGNSIQSLLKKSTCVYWQFEVKEQKGGGKGGARWETVRKESSGPFEIDDMTGRINIQDRDTDLVLENESALAIDQQTDTLLQNLGVEIKGFLGFKKKIRVYERLINPEEEIFVLGRIHKSQEAISISGTTIIPLVISNLSKGMMIRTLFWRSVRPMIIPYLMGIAFIVFFLYSLYK